MWLIIEGRSVIFVGLLGKKNGMPFNILYYRQLNTERLKPDLVILINTCIPAKNFYPLLFDILLKYIIVCLNALYTWYLHQHNKKHMH